MLPPHLHRVPDRVRVVLVSLAILAPGAAIAQDQVRTFTDPFLVLNPGGHGAPVRAVAFTRDGRTLISGGQDKVAHVWDLAATPPRLTRTIRPARWRGLRGNINTLALSPPGADGASILAMAGHGIESKGGTITLVRFPGAPDFPTGEPLGYLHSKDRADGHEQPVGALAFSPTDGAWLASGSNDGTVRVWDMKTRRVVAVLPHGKAQVTALAFTPSGRLVSGAEDGQVRVWDLSTLRAMPPVAPAAPVAIAPHARPIAGDRAASLITAMAVSPDGRYVVAGYEGGDLTRFDLAAPNLAASGASMLMETRAGDGRRRGAIEAVTIGPNNVLAVSLLTNPIRARWEKPSPACDVELRSLLDGTAFPGWAWKSSNLVKAMAFSPDGRKLAFAGGDDQAIAIRDLTNARAPEIRLSGAGSTLWDVRFSRDGRSLAFSRNPGAAPNWEGFHLRDRAPQSIDAAQVAGRFDQLAGWRVQPLTEFDLNILPPPGQAGGFQIRLDPIQERRWWSHTFLPGGPGHAQPTVAIACDTGVAIYNLQTGVRTRFLNGHEGAVYSVAPSPDGRWLATGSVDQTARIWSLAGCDQLPKLGAAFERREDATRLVTAVEPGSFADAMGLLKGDTILSIAIDGVPVRGPAPIDEAAARDKGVDLARVPIDAERVDDAFARLDTTDPRLREEFLVRRTGPDGRVIHDTVGSSRRDSPALSVFVALDREWVMWMPQGYYDSSVVGDSRFIGWHRNNALLTDPIAKPTEFLPIVRFEERFRQRRVPRANVLDRLLDSADVRVAVAPLPPPRPVEPDWPPQVRLAAAKAADLPANANPAALMDPGGGAVAPGETLPTKIQSDTGKPLALSVAVDATGRSPMADLEILADGQVIAPLRAANPALPRSETPILLDLPPGPHRVVARAKNGQGIDGVAAIDVLVRGVAAAPPRTPQLKIIALAPAIHKSLPPIPLAEEDIQDLAPSLRKHLVADASGLRFARPEDGEDAMLTGTTATGDAITKEFDRLKSGSYVAGDMVVVLIETHVLSFGSQSSLVPADATGIPPDHLIPAEAVSEALGQLTKAGCRVLVLIDGVHTRSGGAWDTDITEWVKHLRNARRVVACVASKQGPSEWARGMDHRIFAQAVLDALESPQTAGAEKIRTLADFRDLIEAGVQARTSRRQLPAVYIPDEIAADTPLTDPGKAPRAK